MPALLQLTQATIRFGGLTAVNAVDFTVGENELCGLIGPNGAGKTTVFNLITGVYQPTDGTVTFNGRPVAEYRMIIYSLMLILLMLARPQGLFNFKLGKAKS